jgi:hypothetical protein
MRFSPRGTYDQLPVSRTTLDQGLVALPISNVMLEGAGVDSSAGNRQPSSQDSVEADMIDKSTGLGVGVHDAILPKPRCEP